MTYNPNKGLYVTNEELWQKVKEKAARPDIDRKISTIIIRLLEMWVNGEVIPYPEKNENA